MASNIWKKIIKKIEPHLDPEIAEVLARLSRENINEFGIDPFGLDPDSIKLMAPLSLWLYKNYFRCETYGMEHVPEGRMLVIANHSGQLPFDGLMIATAFMLKADPPRILRGMAERWSAELPFISTMFARGGSVVGEPNTCRRLLNMNEAVLVFPEGVRGISKLFANRYQLTHFGHGFMRLALETKTPIVPIAVIGAEEQAPSIANITTLAHILNIPSVPIIFPQLLPIPLPTKYHIHIGRPLTFKGDGTEDDDIVSDYVNQTKVHIQSMINKGLKERKSIFF